MKRTFFAALFLFTTFSFLTAAEPERLDSYLGIIPLASGIYRVEDTSIWPSNSLLAEMKNGEILLVDTPCTPKETAVLLNWIENKFGKRKITAVNTHFHIDRLGGNEALIKKGIPVWGSDLTAKLLSEKWERQFRDAADSTDDPVIKTEINKMKFFPPTKLFPLKEGLTLDFGGEKAVIAYYGAGHTEDNVTVYLPSGKILFGGCMIYSADRNYLGNIADGNLTEWIKTMKKLSSIDAALVIPGHGSEGGQELIAHTLKVLEK